MRIMVAGGAGYVGSVLVPLLLEHGHEVDVVDLLWFGNHLPWEVDVSQRDLLDSTEKDFTGYDQVIFLAGLSNDPMAEFSPSKNFIQNGALPSFLAYLAKRAGVRRFVYASSCSVYGYTENELYDEDCPVTCQYPYGISKLQGERGVLQLQDSDFSTIALRQGTVCGYSPRMRLDLIVNTMFKSAICDEQININNPAIWRPILDVRDTAMAFVKAVHAAPSTSGVFNVASGNFTVGQIGEMVKDRLETLTGLRIDLNVKHVKDFRNYKVTCERAKAALGFSPRYTITDIVNSLYSHIGEYGDFSSDEFYNIKTFQKQFVPQVRLVA